MLLNNIQKSGFSFNKHEANWEFQFKILNTIMLIAMFFSFLFALLHDLKINDIGAIHSKVDYAYSFLSLILLLILRRSRKFYTVVARTFIFISFCTFVSALVFVLNDEFRIIWFYFLIYVTYVLLGSVSGVIVSSITIITIIICNHLIDLKISDAGIYTATLGLLIASLLSRVYTTQMHQYESQLKSKTDELEQKVYELDIALDQAQQASKAKSLFLASMSHEIRTPMNGVLGMIQVLRGTSLDAEQQHYVETLSSSSKSLLRLIDDLLDLSKIESGKLVLDIETFKLFDWITDIQNITEPLFENKKAAFITDISDELPTYLKGDAARLLQIVVNLISNAAKSTYEGEVKLSIGGQPVNDHLFNLKISVEDTGVGIPQDKLQLIFEAFQQLESDRTENKGVGLGLAISKRLADLMDGCFHVTSRPGKGSCFIFNVSLPVAISDQHFGNTDKQPVHSKTLEILLVDDDAINRLAARTLLEQAGQKVTEAENGQLALDIVSRNTFDVILMDIHMPILDGISATQKIRSANHGKKYVPIIGLTASVMSDEKERYLRAGMDAVVEKPIIIEKLITTINGLVNQSL